MSGMDRLTDEALDEALLNQQCWDFVDWLSVTGSQLSGQSWNHIKPKLREMILAHRRASQADPAPSDGLRETLDYVLQDDLHNRLTPRVVDIAYSAFMLGRAGKNKDDGGPCDWFNDTKPMVDEQIGKIRAALTPAPAQEGGE